MTYVIILLYLILLYWSISVLDVIKISSFKVDIIGEGHNMQFFTQAINNFPIKTGDILNTEKYKTTKNTVFEEKATKTLDNFL